MGLISSKKAVGLIAKVSKEIRDANYRYNTTFYKNAIRIVSEGDSWFHFPLMPLQKDIINHLIYFDDSPYAVYSAGYPGDDLLGFVSKNAQGHLEGEIVDALATEQPQFLLISGGGNDILRSDIGGMERIVRQVDPSEPDRNGQDYLNDYYKNTLLDKIIAQFKDIFDHAKVHNQGCEILTYSYCYMRPYNDDYIERPLSKPLAAGGKVGINPTDLPGVDHKQIMRDVAKAVIDTFHQRLAELASTYPKVHIIDCRDALSDTDWLDEGHPNTRGCGKIAQKFEDKMLSLLGLTKRPVLEAIESDDPMP